MRLFLTFGTTHGAMRAERILRTAGLAPEVVPKPAGIRGSCGVAVRLAPACRAAALVALAAAGHLPRQETLLP
ncbi:MAG TPA: DUF3343 domain-containing protein [Bacillota bacterium]|nr:DUF3343 domain-containing protein [Bacillota bacterium]